MISEEICGRFGSFDGSTSSYRATSEAHFVLSDDVVSASLFGRLLVTLVTESTTNRKDACDVQ